MFLLKSRHSLSGNLAFLKDLRRQHRGLYREKVETDSDGSVKFHKAQLFKRAGVFVLHLKGDAFEMAFQHGRLLSNEIRNGVLFQLGRTIPSTIQNTITKHPLINRALLTFLDFMEHNVLMKNIPREYLSETFALSEGSGLSMHGITRSLLSIEAVSILSKYAAKSKSVFVNPIAFSGCSSFVTWGEHARNGEMVIGRNLDYPLNGYFDAYPVVAYCEPSHSQRFISITSAGLNTPSLTAFNESGIFLSVHMIPTEETSFKGTPIYFVASDCIKHARTFDEAIAIFRKYRTTCGWSYVLVSMKEKRAGSVDVTHKGMAVTEASSPLHIQTNHFLSHEMEKAGLHINQSIRTDSHGRFLRMNQLLREAHGTVDKSVASKVLADTWDPIEKKNRGLGNTLAVHITLGSAIVTPASGNFFVANGTAPTSHNDFIEFPFWEKFRPKEFGKESFEVLRGGLFKENHPRMAEAIQCYIKAKMAYEYESDVATSENLMTRVTELDPTNPAYFFVQAVLQLKLGRFEGARVILDKVLEMDPPGHLKCLSHYYRGRVFAHLEKRNEALAEFEKVLQASEDDKLKKAAKKSKHRVQLMGKYPFKTDRLPLLMQFADLVNY